MNILFMTNSPTSHQIEFYQAIGRSGRASLSVRFTFPDYRGQSWKPDENTAFDSKFLFRIGPKTRYRRCQICPGAIVEAMFSNYDFYLLGGDYICPTTLICAFLLWIRRKPWGIWAERPWPKNYRVTWSREKSARSKVVRKLRQLLLSAYNHMNARWFCVGTAAVRDYQSYGAKQEQCVWLPYVCDLARYNNVDPASVEETRKQYDLAGKLVYLFSGRIVEGKGVDVLIKAFNQLARACPDVALLVLGDGPLRKEMEASVDVNVRNRVHFTGHLSQAKLPSHFTVADVFAFSSRYDGWGMVVSEACGAGLPIITTNMVASGEDLVVEGKNGFIIPVDDADALLDKMRFFAENREYIKSFGDLSREISARITLEKGVELLLEGIENKKK